MVMLKQEVKKLLNKIEKELLEFVIFIRNLEAENSKASPNSRKKYGYNQQKEAVLNDSVDGSAIVDALCIVKNILLRISNLIDEFSLILAEGVSQNLQSCRSYSLKYYYTQYVYQISSYLVKLLVKHLEQFSEKLDDLASQKLEITSSSFESQQVEEIPTHSTLFKSTTQKPVGTVCIQNDSAHIEAESFKDKLRPIPKKSSSDSLVPGSTDSDETTHSSQKSCAVNDDWTDDILTELQNSLKTLVTVVDHLLPFKDSRSARQDLTFGVRKSGFFSTGSCTKCHENQKQKNKISDFRCEAANNDLKNSLHALVTVIEDLLMQFKGSKCANQDLTPKMQKAGLCCPESCRKCCKDCKYKHMMPDLREFGGNKKSGFSWNENFFPNLNSEPIWRTIDSAESDGSTNSWQTEGIAKLTSKNNEICSRTECSSPTRKKIKDQGTRDIKHRGTQCYSTCDTNNYTMHSPIANDCNELERQSDEFISQNGGAEKPKVEKIQPGKMTRRLSSGSLNRKIHNPEKKQARKPPARLYEHERESLSQGLACLVEKELFDKKPSRSDPECGKASERDLKPVFYDEQKQMFLCDALDGFCRLPEPNSKEDNSPTEREVLVDKTRYKDSAYPQELVFNLQMFSNLLKDKFGNYFSQPPAKTENDEAETILDIVFESVNESVNCPITDESSSDESEIRQTESSDKYKERKEGQDLKGGKTIDGLVNEIVNIATQITHHVNDADDKKFIPSNKKALKNLNIYVTDSTSGQHFEILIPKISRMKQPKACEATQACESCINMVEPGLADSEGEIKFFGEKHCFTRKSLKGCCFFCWNARQQGLSIHQCHDCLPSGVLEMRHMSESGKVCVCYLKWDKSKEPEDWRWHKTHISDSTRVELQQQTTRENDAVLKVIYGPEGNMVKESLAETELKVLNDGPNMSTYTTKQSSSSDSGVDRQSASASQLDSLKNTNKNGKQKPCGQKGIQDDLKNIVTKLGRFFDDIRKVGLGKGPPLVIRLRRRTALNDAYNLLMVPSKISLSYYRTLRVIFVAEKGRCMKPTSNNFIEEDQSDELFSMFEKELFRPYAMDLFEYPSKESQVLYLNPDTSSHYQWIRFAGTTLALAILHQKQMDANLAISLYKCLMDRPLYINDLEEIDPSYYRRLTRMKEQDITNRKGKKYTFTVVDKIDGYTVEQELVDEGRNIAVTEENKYQFIDLALKWKLAQRCLSQLKEFRSGFATVLEPCFLIRFSEKELQSIIRSPPDCELFISESTSMRKNKEISRRETC